MIYYVRGDMSLLSDIRKCFRPVLAEYVESPEEVEELLLTIRSCRTQEDVDYSMPLALPLAKRLGRDSRELAAEIVSRVNGVAAHVRTKSPATKTSR